MVKRLPAMGETQVWSLGQEDPLEKEMATHSSMLAWKIPWMEEPGWLQSMGSQRVGQDWATSLHFTSCLKRASQVALAVKEPNLSANAGDRRDTGSVPGSARSPGGGRGYPLQSLLGNPMNRGAWQATVPGVAKRWTRLSANTHTHTHTHTPYKGPF